MATQKFSAVYKKRGKWYIGWIEELPGVNTQGKTLRDVKENLKEAAALVIETNRLISRQEFASKGKTLREPIIVPL